MSVIAQRELVEAHPPMVVAHHSNAEKTYDLREIALWILDNPEQAQYRLSDWWNAPRREQSYYDERPHLPDAFKAFIGTPVYFLSFEIELAAYRLIAYASRSEIYRPDDIQLVMRGGAPA